MTFGERMKQARRLKGYTQSEIAAALDVTYQTIQYYENGKKKGTLKGHKLEILAEMLDVSIEWLKTGHNPNNLNKIEEPKAEYKTSRKEEPQGIPLIDFIDAADADKLNSERINIYDFIYTKMPHSQYAFAVTNPNNNMRGTSDNIQLNKGDILIIEPCITPIDGEAVMICLSETKKTSIIAQMLVNPLNGQLSIRQTGDTAPSKETFPLPKDAKIIGTIIERKTRLIEPKAAAARLNQTP